MYRVIDADGHVTERDQELAEYAEYRGESLHSQARVGVAPFFPSLDGWFRSSMKRPAGDVEQWLQFLDETGIELTFLYPTSGLGFGLVQDHDWATSLARAYNDWLYHRYMKVSPKLRGLALVPVHDVSAAVQELRRAVQELGMPGAVLPAATMLGKAYGHKDFHPLYEEARRLNAVLAIHGAPSRGFGFDFFDKFISTHTLEHPVAIFIQFTSMMFDGVFEYFPEVRFAFLEAGAGWVPYMMDRMDEEYERRGQRWCPYLTKSPSEYIRSGNVYFSCEVEEKTLPFVIQSIGEDRLFFASDFPHERDRHQFQGDIPHFTSRTDLSETVKRKILFDNAQRFYVL